MGRYSRMVLFVSYILLRLEVATVRDQPYDPL